MENQPQPENTPQKPNLVPFDARKLPRFLIANLAGAVRMFQPNFVNEDDKKPGVEYSEPIKGKFWDGTFTGIEGAPTFDQFINTAAGAIEELGEFIKTHEALKSILKQTQQAFAEIQEIVLERKVEHELKPMSTIAEVKRLKLMHSQMADVISRASSCSPEKALACVQAYIFPNGQIPPILGDNKEN